MRILPEPAAILLFALPLAACVGAAPQPRTAAGECGDVYGGEVCTWANLVDGEVVELGATVPLASVEGAPADMEMSWPPVASAVLALPAEAAEATGLRLLTIYWEAHGHPPAAFMTPHFDFHFYNVPRANVDAIECDDPVKPATLPDGYILPDEEIPGLGTLVGICVPAMGMHSLPRADYEAASTFTGTMVVGYDDQRPIFIEPMISQAHLARRASFEIAMPTGLAAEGVRYPKRFRADYDAATDAYRFTFSEF